MALIYMGNACMRACLTGCLACFLMSASKDVERESPMWASSRKGKACCR